MTVSVTPLATYRTESPYPFCPGCGHGTILDHLDEALLRLDLDPRRVVLVSDIGCAGLSDQYFRTSALHGLHGRSLTYAAGIKLARPDLEVLVIMGDGGTGIGGAHFLNAARRNIGMTVLVFNNLNFGMTGGQHSTTTPVGSITSTTPGGNLERPLDICATAQVNGAAYVYRGTTFDSDLTDRVVEAIETPGFSVLDIWELCSAYFMPANKFGRRALEATQRELGFDRGVLVKRSVDEYSAAYRAQSSARSRLTAALLGVSFRADLSGPVKIVVAGSAGGKVRSAVRLVGEAAIMSGLFATQRDDYPITVKTGHSLSELIVAPEPIDYTGIERPDTLLILSEEGLQKSRSYLAAMEAGDLVVAMPDLGDIETAARVEILAPATKIGRAEAAVVAMTALVVGRGLLPVEALRAAASAGRQYADQNLTAVEKGFDLAGTLPAH